MRNIRSIFIKDIKSISTNWVAAILIGGLIFLPSLYAWLNILASWDPYGQTGQFPIGIVNEDVGASIRGENINAGDELVQTLKSNHDMNWQFTNRDEAMEKVEYGDYFAVIIIPKNFTERLGSVISEVPQKANVDYYVNEKINSIAPKISDTGVSLIVDQMSNEFAAIVNGTIFDVFNKLGIEIEADLPDIQKFERYVFEIEQKLPDIHQSLNASLSDAASAQKIIQSTQGSLSNVKKLTDDGLSTIANTTDFLTKAESGFNELVPQINRDLQKVQDIAQQANKLLTKLKLVKVDTSDLENTQKKLDQQMTNAISTVDTIIESLTDLRQMNAQNTDFQSKEKLDDAIQKTTALKGTLQEAQTNARNINKLVLSKETQLKDSITDLQKIAENTSVQIDSFINEYKNTIEPTVLSEIKKVKQMLTEAKGIMNGIQTILPEVDRILTSTSSHVNDGKELIETVLNEYPYISNKVTELAKRIRSFQSEMNINDFIQLLQNNPSAESEFLKQPIELNEHKLFPIENYGTSMTPFYSVLAIWVGCLLLISLLSVNVHQGDLYHAREIYFGKLLTFGTIGIMQTLIVTAGDIALLGVKVQEPFWFIIFGLFISSVFISIVYTFVSVFGDIGKAFSIIMLVLQIAGSGGTYPVPLLPEFFQWINPALPFTYAIDLMREAVGGIIWRKAGIDILFLSCVGILFLLFGAFLKEKSNKKTNELLKKSRQSGLFH
ncbi:YhgE/Pip domain-containing protein [Psychrobacillus sp. FSL H8-0483]|uniref:YhgE/Pip domain-containing protein n=1 Tax=Psychrobacillus sp. FSL H8-0483 TaxID=2921389 RepID=UPI00315A4454